MLLTDKQKLGIFCIIVFSLFFIILMQIQLMAALLAGLLTYTLTIKLDYLLLKKMNRLSDKSKLFSVLILSIIISLIFIGGFSYLFSVFLNIAKHPVEVINNIKMILDKVSNALPPTISTYLPDDFDKIHEAIFSYLKDHLIYFQSIIKHVLHLLIIIIIGFIIGLILGFGKNKRNTKEKKITVTPLAQALSECLDRLVLVFQYVALSQVFIAAFNTLLTAIFIFMVLPIFDINFPFRKTLVLATFVFGLLPIIGNLIVNTILFIVGFSVSFHVAILILIYSIIIHKFEYLLNAKIIGNKIHAGICELLIAMLFFETLFGMIGLIFAPIFYAFLTLSLKDLKLL